MVEIRKLTASLSLTGNAADKLGSFGLAVNGVKAGIGLLVDGFKIAKKVLFDFTADIAAQGDEIAKTAKNSALTAESFQELAFAAELAGSNGTVLAKGIQTLNRNLIDARTKGTGPFVDTLKSLNIGIEEFDGLGADEAFEKFADIISELPTELEKTAFAQATLGRAGKELIPVLNKGADGIRRQREEARKLGIFTNEQAAASEDLVDAQLRLDKTLDSIKITIGSELIPIVTEIIDGVREWLGENDEIIKQRLQDEIAKITQAMETLKPVLIAVGEALVALPGFIAEVAEETVLLVREFEFLDKQLEEDTKLWGLVKESVLAMINPLGFLIDKFNEVIDLLGLELRPEVRGLINDAKAFIGLGPETKTVAIRGQGAQQVQVRAGPGRGGVGGTKNEFAQKSIASGNLSDGRLKQMEGDVQLSASTRAAAGEARQLLAANKQRAEAQAKQQEKDNKKSVAAAKRFLGDRFGIFDDATVAAREGANRRKELQKNFKGGGRGGKGKASADDELSDQDLLALINQAGQTGESLTGLIGGRKTPGGVPPVITVTLVQQDVDMDIDVIVNGVPGTTAEEVGNIAAERVSEELLNIIKDAKDNLAPQEGI